MQGLTVQLTLPDLWQQEALSHLKAGSDVVLDAPTGAGKTWVFELLVSGKYLKGQSIYTVPTRALANDKFAEWKRKGWDVGIATGDLATNLDAPVIVATLETQRERFLSGEGPELLVIDEYQMIGDPVRGLNYELAVALAPHDTRLLLMSGSVGNPLDAVNWLGHLGRPAELVQTATRPVPLQELHMAELPYRAPQSVKGFWPRLALEVLAASAGPLLIFAPQRANAEKIARKVAKALPSETPVQLSEAQKSACGKDLLALLERRVAFHHSGLSFAQRAGIIEPLAKAGQLRVVVATMGLASGINFSMRSVVISGTQYYDGDVPRDVAPDELLQMFGRAGRRGLDEIGFVIIGNDTPRLIDAAPKHLRRANEIDWPTLLRVMHRASQQRESPIDAARTLCRSLFSQQKIELGFSRVATGNETDTTEAAFGLAPSHREIFNSLGEWEIWREDHVTSAQYGAAFLATKKGPMPALSVFSFVAKAFSVGRVGTLSTKDGKRTYGREITVAARQADSKNGRDYSLTRNIRKWLDRKKSDRFTFDELREDVVPKLAPRLEGGSIANLQDRNGTAMALVDFSSIECDVYRDNHGVLLVEPRQRHVSLDVDPKVVDSTGNEHEAVPGTAAHAWRKLGLISPDGTPTRRGVVFSFFNHGDGLAIAAALEDESYPVRELAIHLANIRGGYRFEDASDAEALGSERLAAVCRQTYGVVSHVGYLDLGLPVGYGGNTAEVVAAIARDPNSKRRLAREFLGEGDIERAMVEWLSLLRHIVHAPDYDWPRWQALRAEASAVLASHKDQSPSHDLPQLSTNQLTRPFRHEVFLKRR